jgi:hypothetical protein
MLQIKAFEEIVIQWQILKKKQLHAELNNIELKMAEIFENCPTQIFGQEDLDLLKSLKQRKDSILSTEESSGGSGVELYGSRKEIKTLNFFINLPHKEDVKTQFGTYLMRMGIIKSTELRLRRLPIIILKHSIAL